MAKVPPISDEIRLRERAARRLAERLGLQFEKPRSRDPQSPAYGQYKLLAMSSYVAGNDHAGVPLAEIEKLLEKVQATGGWNMDASGRFSLKARAGGKPKK
jgi:hypothetical protein